MSQVKLTTNHGDILIELDAAKAPLSVANFLNYVRNGHYNGTVFHRVIKGFMSGFYRRGYFPGDCGQLAAKRGFASAQLLKVQG